MDILYLFHHVYFYRNKTDYLKAYRFGVIGSQHVANMVIGKDKVCLDSARENMHLFGTICFKGVLFMSPSSSSDFNFLLFMLYTISVVHFLLLNKENKCIIKSC